MVAQRNTLLKNFTPGEDHIYEQGFLFAPFRETENVQRVIIRSDIFCDADKLPEPNFAVEQVRIGTPVYKQRLKPQKKAAFKNYVRTIRKQIRKGSFQKIVAARVAKKKKPENFSAPAFFTALCEKYPNAFVSLVYTQEYGLWIGASPEILLEVNATGFKTYSLAGTKANTQWNNKTAWGEKEKEEQEIVTRYITNAFAAVTKTEAKITGPETIEAGNLLHLRTTFLYDSIPHFNWQKVVEQLHPTPAVAGLPKGESIKFITEHEKFERGFYSGFLGPVNLDEEINLFVNLRCMKVLKSKLALFVGCGITADSKPSKEWTESRIKTQTLLSVLQPKTELNVSKNIASLPPDANSEERGTTDSGNLQAQGNP
ncbi:MAG: isochorismate synthase [Chitinophagales bacterium]